MDDTGPIVETVQIDADDSLAKSKMESFGSWVQGWGKKLTIAAGLVSGLAGSVQAAFAKSAADLSSYSVAQSKLAETHSLTTDELQALQLQAQQTGVSLDKLIESGQGASAAWLAAGNALGTSISPEAIAAGVNLSRAIGLAKDQVKALWMNIGAHLAPSMTEFWKISQGVLSVVIRWVKENGPLVQTVSKIASAAAVVAGALAGAGSVLWGVGAAIGWLTPIVGTLGGALVTFLVSPMGMVAVAATAGVAALLYFSGAARQMVAGVGGDFGAMWQAAVDAFGKIYQFVMSTVGGIKQALAAGDLALAAEIGWSAVKVVWYKGASEVVAMLSSAMTTAAGIAGQSLTAIASMLADFATQFDLSGKLEKFGNDFAQFETQAVNTFLTLANQVDTFWTLFKLGAKAVFGELWLNFKRLENFIGSLVTKADGLMIAAAKATDPIGWAKGDYDQRTKQNQYASAAHSKTGADLAAQHGQLKEGDDAFMREQAAGLLERTSARNAARYTAESRVGSVSGDDIKGVGDSMAEAVRKSMETLATGSGGIADGLKESLSNATDKWQQGLAKAGQLPGLVPGAGGPAGGGGSPDQVRQSAMATFSAVAAGQTGATSSTVPTQQLQTQRTIAENTAETNRLLRNPRPLTVGV